MRHQLRRGDILDGNGVVLSIRDHGVTVNVVMSKITRRFRSRSADHGRPFVKIALIKGIPLSKLAGDSGMSLINAILRGRTPSAGLGSRPPSGACRA